MIIMMTDAGQACKILPQLKLIIREAIMDDRISLLRK